MGNASPVHDEVVCPEIQVLGKRLTELQEDVREVKGLLRDEMGVQSDLRRIEQHLARLGKRLDQIEGLLGKGGGTNKPSGDSIEKR